MRFSSRNQKRADLLGLRNKISLAVDKLKVKKLSAESFRGSLRVREQLPNVNGGYFGLVLAQIKFTVIRDKTSVVRPRQKFRTVDNRSRPRRYELSLW